MSKLVSVVIPLFNCEKYIGACLESLLQQTYKDIEVLVVDNASTDNGKEIVQTFVKKDKRFILLQGGADKGVSYARKLGTEAATGDYLMFVDADDYVMPEMLTKMTAAIKDFDICFCNHFLDRNGERIKTQVRTAAGIYEGKLLDGLRSGKMIFSPKGFNEMSLYGTLWGKLYNIKLVKDNLQYFDTELWYSEDHYLLTALMLDAQSCVAINDFLYCYRQNPKQITHRYKEKFLANSIVLYQKWQKLLQVKGAKQDLQLANAEFLLKMVEGSIKAEVRESGKNYTECYAFLQSVYQNPLIKEVLQSVDLHQFDKSCCKYLTWLKQGWLRLIYYSLRLHK
jgi:glycosyltransferase involved in cell wall biosynthesis